MIEIVETLAIFGFLCILGFFAAAWQHIATEHKKKKDQNHRN